MLGDTCINYVPDAEKEIVEQNVSKELQRYGLRGEIVRAATGYMVGQLAESFVSDDDETSWFPFLTAALATRTVRSRLKHRIERFSESVSKNLDLTPDEQANIDFENLVKETEPARYLFGVELDNIPFAREVSAVWNVLRNTYRSGGDIVNGLLKNKFTQSPFTFLSSLGIEKAKEFRDFLNDFSPFIKKIQVQPSVQFDKKYGNGAFQRMFEEKNAAEFFRKITGQDLNDEDAAFRFNESVQRILYSGGKMKDGRYVFSEDDYPNIVRHYDSVPRDLEADTRLIQNEQFADLILSIRESYNQYHKEYIRLMNNQIIRKIRRDLAGDEEAQQAMENLTSQRKSVKQYIKDLKTSSSKEDNIFGDYLEKLYGVRLTRQIMDMHDAVLKFGKYESNYAPQYYSSTKVNKVRAIWERENAHKYQTKQQLEMAWENYVADETYKINGKGKKGSVFVYDESTGTVITKEFKTRTEALSFIDLYRRGLSESEETDFAAVFVKENTREVKNSKGKIVQKKYYTIEVPEGKKNPFDKFNRDAYKQSIRFVRLGAHVKESNHLDHARNTLMPFWMMESNFEKINRKYALDAGRRIYNLRHDIVDNADLHYKFINPIIDELRKKVPENSAVIKDTKDRLEAIYNIVNRVIGNSVNDVEKSLRLQKAINIYRNVLMAAYGYGISFYTPFEMVQQAALISSWKSAGTVLKNYAKNKEALNNMEKWIVDNHIIGRHLNTNYVDFDSYTPDMTAGGVVDAWEGITGSVADFFTKSSFSKMLLNLARKTGVVDVDIDDLGLLKVVFGDFITGNITSTAVNARTAMEEVLNVARLLKEQRDNLEKAARGEIELSNTVFIKDSITGKNFTREQLLRKLEMFGIVDADEIEHLIEKLPKYRQALLDIESDRFAKQLPLEQIRADDDLHRIYNTLYKTASYATESMHGTNVLYRPEMASSGGLTSLLYQFSTYQINLAVQNWSRRVATPIREYVQKYGKFKGISALKLYPAYRAFKSGYISELRAMGLTDEMIEAFPVESVEHALKAAATIFGFGLASQVTLSFLSDLAAYTFTDDDDFNRVKNTFVVGKDPLGNTITLTDLARDGGIENMGSLFMWTAGMFARYGAGSYGTILQQMNYGNSSIMDLTPITGDINKVWKLLVGTKGQNSLADASLYFGRESARFFVNRLPLINSRPFNGITSQLLKREINKKGYKLRDSQSKSFIDLDLSLDMNEIDLDL